MVTKKDNEMEAFKTWEEMSTLEQMACQFWDMYKDAHGYRPRHVDTSAWTEADFEAEFKQLAEVIDYENKARVAREAKAVQEFEGRIDKLLRMGAHDRVMAIRWIHEAEETGGDDEYLCYTVGLPYGYFRKVA
jgi:hypothetical protein